MRTQKEEEKGRAGERGAGGIQICISLSPQCHPEGCIVYIDIDMSVWIRVYKSVCVCTHIYIYTHMCVCACSTHTVVRTYVYAHTSICMRRYRYIIVQHMLLDSVCTHVRRMPTRLWVGGCIFTSFSCSLFHRLGSLAIQTQRCHGDSPTHALHSLKGFGSRA